VVNFVSADHEAAGLVPEPRKCPGEPNPPLRSIARRVTAQEEDRIASLLVDQEFTVSVPVPDVTVGALGMSHVIQQEHIHPSTIRGSRPAEPTAIHLAGTIMIAAEADGVS
jgi:hypothetical protein